MKLIKKLNQALLVATLATTTSITTLAAAPVVKPITTPTSTSLAEAVLDSAINEQDDVVINEPNNGEYDDAFLVDPEEDIHPEEYYGALANDFDNVLGWLCTQDKINDVYITSSNKALIKNNVVYGLNGKGIIDLNTAVIKSPDTGNVLVDKNDNIYADGKMIITADGEVNTQIAELIVSKDNLRTIVDKKNKNVVYYKETKSSVDYTVDYQIKDGNKYIKVSHDTKLISNNQHIYTATVFFNNFALVGNYIQTSYYSLNKDGSLGTKYFTMDSSGFTYSPDTVNVKNFTYNIATILPNVKEAGQLANRFKKTQGLNEAKSAETNKVIIDKNANIFAKNGTKIADSKGNIYNTNGKLVVAADGTIYAPTGDVLINKDGKINTNKFAVEITISQDEDKEKPELTDVKIYAKNDKAKTTVAEITNLFVIKEIKIFDTASKEADNTVFTLLTINDETFGKDTYYEVADGTQVEDMEDRVIVRDADDNELISIETLGTKKVVDVNAEYAYTQIQASNIAPAQLLDCKKAIPDLSAYTKEEVTIDGFTVLDKEGNMYNQYAGLVIDKDGAIYAPYNIEDLDKGTNHSTDNGTNQGIEHVIYKGPKLIDKDGNILDDNNNIIIDKTGKVVSQDVAVRIGTFAGKTQKVYYNKKNPSRIYLQTREFGNGDKEMILYSSTGNEVSIQEGTDTYEDSTETYQYWAIQDDEISFVVYSDGEQIVRNYADTELYGVKYNESGKLEFFKTNSLYDDEVTE